MFAPEISMLQNIGLVSLIYLNSEPGIKAFVNWEMLRALVNNLKVEIIHTENHQMCNK